MSNPRFRIPVHVFGYSLAVIPTLVYAYYYQKNAPTDEELEKILKENYSRNIRQSQAKRQDMIKFLESAKNAGNDETLEKQMEGVLHAGKGQMKRHYPVDERYYGTQEGIEARERMEKKLRDKKPNQLQQQQQKTKQKNATVKETKEVSPGDSPQLNETTTAYSIQALAGFGIIAAIAGFLLGGSRS